MKQFANLWLFLRSLEFKNKDLSYCDLSNLNLGKIPLDRWKGFKFFHTNFSNTQIHFDPYSLATDEKGIFILEYCDFTNCDLSYIKELSFLSIIGSNFTNTHLSAALDFATLNFTNVIFSEEMFSKIHYELHKGIVDLNTIYLNPHIFFTSLDLFYIIKRSLPSKYQFIASSKYLDYIKQIDKVLEEDKKREGILWKLYCSLEVGTFSVIDKIRFFQGLVSKKEYDVVDFSYVPYLLLSQIIFKNCKFNQVIMPNDTPSIRQGGLIMVDDVGYTKIPHIIIPDMNVSSWQTILYERLNKTCFTTQRNLYLELGRSCNAKCSFCRNQYLEPCSFDLGAIVSHFKEIAFYLNNVVIGGGEPTLIRQQLKSFLKSVENYSIQYYISTNGSCGILELSDLSRLCHINLSRHAVSDFDNNNIFGIKTLGVEDIKKLNMLMKEKKRLTLVATCFQGGLDTVKSLEEYISLGMYLNVSGILFQTLHEDLDKTSVQIDSQIFDEVIMHLKEQGFLVGEIPIYSTGDYKLIIVKDIYKEKTISFKKYITKEELEKEWYRAAKRTFDLSMAPNGDIFENWHQASNPVLIRKRENF